MTPNTVITLVGLFVIFTIAFHLLIYVRRRRLEHEATLLETAKSLIKRFDIDLDEESCEECGDDCLLYRTYKELEKDNAGSRDSSV